MQGLKNTGTEVKNKNEEMIFIMLQGLKTIIYRGATASWVMSYM